MAILLSRKKHTGAPAPSWLMTFADLATLLLTFFILLLSFSKMDIEKYRMMAQSMADAFGVSFIQGPATGGTITLIESDVVAPPAPAEPAPAIVPTTTPEVQTPPPPVPAESTGPSEGVETLAFNLVKELEREIASEKLNVSYDRAQVTIRFADEATFTSGSAELKPDMVPIIDKIVNAIQSCQGTLVVSGYTDDRPIAGSRYRSNWDLSAARAVSVVHYLVLDRRIDAEKVMASGHAETHPLAPNNTDANRALNRRVEIRIENPECADAALPW